MTAFNRITSDPKVMAGRPCIRGTRIPASLVVNLVANGMSFSHILDEYPDLEEGDIRQALRFAAALAEDELHPIPAAGA